MLARRLLDANLRISRQIDVRARQFGRRDGNFLFLNDTLPGLLQPGMRVLDVGGGKHPSIPLEVKVNLGLTVHGLDISADELRRAPEHSYDETIVCDVSRVDLDRQYDLIFSCAVLEHVPDVRGAIRNLANGLRAGATMAHFVPNALALFALANRVLGAKWGPRVLFAALPSATLFQGFPAYYHDCWPSRLAAICTESGLEVNSLEPHFSSGYASFFVPLHLADVARQLSFKRARWTNLCESFTIIVSRER